MRSSRSPSRRVVVAFLALWACCPIAARAARLHVIIASDRAQPAIGEDMEISRDSFLGAVVLNTPADRCIIWEINLSPSKARPEMENIRTTIHPFGRELSRNTILGAIQNLAVAPDDAVLFYYCGHGAYSDTYGTYTLPSGNRGQAGAFLSEIRGAIGQKGPRFAAVILDCCNSLRPLPGEPRMFVPFITHRKDFSPLFKQLFFSKAGILSVTSSKPKEYSIIVPAIRHARGEQHFGALFTNVFSEELQSSMERWLSWDQLFADVQPQLDREFRRYCKDGLSIRLGPREWGRQTRQNIDYRW